MKKIYEQHTRELDELKCDMYGKDFLLTREKSMDDLNTILTIAEILKAFKKANMSVRRYDDGYAISHFKDKSTRTKFSFSMACNMLGLSVEHFEESSSQVSHGETIDETANMIAYLSEVVGIRDDMYLGRGNKYMRAVAEALEEGYDGETGRPRPTILNLQCDIDHPTQTMSDLMHLKHYFGGLDNLRGKKIGVCWAYSPTYGKPLSVPQGLIELVTRFGMEVVLAHPPGYELMNSSIEMATKNALELGGSFRVSNDMDEAFDDADVVYPKSWAPYYVMEQRTELLEHNDKKKLSELEQNCLKRNSRFKHWTCSKEMMSRTREKSALYMHCLPADITGLSCESGEVDAEVFKKFRLDLYKEAHYKPFVIAASVLLARFRDPQKLLFDEFFKDLPDRVGSRCC